MNEHDVYPRYAPSERIADGLMHALGIAFAIIGGSALLIWAAMHAAPGHTAALGVYGLGMVSTFVASGFYHMTPWTRIRPVLRRIDHAAIYLMIAGTFTPLSIMVGSPLALSVLAAIWVLAVVGIVRKLFFWAVPGRLGPLTYLAMGLLGLLLVQDLSGIVPGSAMALMAAGGALYAIGILFYSWDGLKFSNAIWHAHVVAASVCFFSAITIGSFAIT